MGAISNAGDAGVVPGHVPTVSSRREQWQKGAAELARTRAEADGLVQQQREYASRSVQSWIEQLQKFDTVEDRVMVLSAAMSTTPYDSVDISQQVALAEHEELPRSRLALAGVPKAGSRPQTPGKAGGASRPEASGTALAPAEVSEAARVTAKKTLDRVSLAEAMLGAAKASARAPVKPSPPGKLN